MARGTHPNSLANLAPAWRRGESGNSSGRPAGNGASRAEWLRILTAQGLTKAELEAIRDDESEQWTKCQAAASLLAGNVEPIDGRIDRGRVELMRDVDDRIDGKPVQRIERVTIDATPPDPARFIEALTGLLDAHPDFARVLLTALRPRLLPMGNTAESPAPALRPAEE